MHSPYPPVMNQSLMNGPLFSEPVIHEDVNSRTKWVTLGLGVLLVVFYTYQMIHRSFFHPLAKYPGSVLASVSTEWYEWYWNIHKPGQLLFEIERLHKIHGPIVRIGVNELHINDPEFFQEITKVGSKFLKEPKFYWGISFPTSSIGLVDPIAHRTRRQILNPLFTSSRIQQIAPGIEAKAEHLCSRVDEIAGSRLHAPVNLFAAFKSFTMDVVSEMVFGQAFGVMDSPGFRHPHLEALHDAVEKAWFARTFPTLVWISLNLPDCVSTNLFPVPILEFGKVCRVRIDKYLQERANPENKVSAVILEQLLEPNEARGHSPPSAHDLNEEALTLLTAGNDTTAHAMILGTYMICSTPEVQMRLNEELNSAFPDLNDRITYERAKNLPYLTAVIKEVLRFSNPLPGRLPRVVPSEGISFNEAALAPGTIVHTSAYLLNRHESIWGKTAHQFEPSRWLNKDSASLDKYMTSFYKGSRQCLGLHLAWCELYLIIGTLFRRYDMRIYETSANPMAWTDHLLMLFNGEFHAEMTRKAE